MSGTNNFLPFDSAGENMMSDENYATNSATINGVSAGQGSSSNFNKAMHQATIMAAAIAGLAANAGVNVSDTDLNTLMGALSSIFVFSPVVANDVQILSTSPQVIASHSNLASENYAINVYLRVLQKTTITVAVTYTDGTGVQTETIQYQVPGLYFPLSSGAQVYAAGSYSLPALFINAKVGTIAVSVTASNANQVYASAAIMGV